jgi:hypothetical protein
MEIISIFDNENQGLFSFVFPDEDFSEFYRLFNSWQDLEYLEEFFESNKSDLDRGYFGTMSVDEAILRTRKDAKQLSKKILDIKKNKDGETLNFLFKPLDNRSYRIEDLQKSKAYGIIRTSWLRLYAIRINDNFYVITGGTIKLTERMDEREHSQKELTKLDTCRDFLRNEGIFDDAGIRD